MNVIEFLRPSVDRKLRRLPRLLGRAMAVTWRAAPRQLVVTTALQFASGVGIAAQLLVGRRLLGELIATNHPATFGGVLPELATAAVIGVVVAFAAVVKAEQQRLLTELVARYAASEVLEVAGSVDLVMFEEPEFYNRLLRAVINAESRPVQVATGLLGILGGLFATGGIAVALLVMQPALLALLVVGYVPSLLVATKASDTLRRFTIAQTEAHRRRAYVFGLVTRRHEAAEVRSLGLVPFLHQQHDQLFDDRITALRDVVRKRTRLLLASEACAAAFTLLGLTVLVWGVTSGRTPVAAGGAAVGAVILLASRLNSLASSGSALYESSLFLEDFTGFVDALKAAAAEAAPTQPAPARGFERLAADGVTFTYPSAAQPSLRSVSVEVKAGELVALVGENGSGKTTLAKVLAGLYEPAEGAVTWDGVDIRTYDPAQVRANVAVIFQDFLRYHLTAGENVGLGRYERRDDLAAIAAAAHSAGADEFIAALPKGYATLLGPEYMGGSDLSVGQWQRMALARAMFRDCPFVILDEPTAALDARAEFALFEQIRTIFAGRAVVVISHRFANVREADRIYVLKDGAVVEQGAHADLLAAGGLYAELFTLQASSYVEMA